MEDAHIIKENLTEDTALFAVFDGHGGNIILSYFKILNIHLIIKINKKWWLYKIGKEVAKFVEKHFIEELKNN